MSFELETVKVVPSAYVSLYEEIILAFLKGDVDTVKVNVPSVAKPMNIRHGIMAWLKREHIKSAVKKAGLLSVDVHCIRHGVYLVKVRK